MDGMNCAGAAQVGWVVKVLLQFGDGGIVIGSELGFHPEGCWWSGL